MVLLWRRLGTIVFAVQKFIGTPLASYFGLKEARFLIDEYRKTGVVPQDTYAPKKESAAGPTFFEGHKKYYGQFTCLAITALFSWIAFVIGKWTGLSATIWALILGAAVGSTGYLPSQYSEARQCRRFTELRCFLCHYPVACHD